MKLDLATTSARLRCYVGGVTRISRRDVVSGAIGAFGVAACEGAKVVAERAMLDPLLAQPETEPWVAAVQPVALIATNGHRRQAVALTLWEAGEAVSAMIDEIDPDGVHAVISLAEPQACYRKIGRGLTVFGSTGGAGAPVISSPDPRYGRFVYQRARECLLSGQPATAVCYGRAATGAEIEYLSLMLPCGLDVVSIGHPRREWTRATRPVSARRGATPPSRGNGATI